MNPAQREGATMRATAWKILLVVVLVLAAVTIPVAGVAAATPSMIQLSTPRVTGNSVVTNGFAQANTPDATIISNNWNWGDRTSADPSFPVTHPYAVPSDPTAAPVHPSVAAPLLTAAATHPAYPLGHAAHCRTDYHSILREHKVKGHEVRHREVRLSRPREHNIHDDHDHTDGVAHHQREHHPVRGRLDHPHLFVNECLNLLAVIQSATLVGQQSRDG